MEGKNPCPQATQQLALQDRCLAEKFGLNNSVMFTTYPMKYFIVLLCLAFSLTAHAKYKECPAKALEYVQKGGAKTLDVIEPVTAESESKWCGIDIPVPESFTYDSSIKITGKAKVEAEESPKHIACLITTTEGKIGFIRLIENPDTDKSQSFSESVKYIYITDESSSKEPFVAGEKIEKISFYASFPQPTECRLTLEEMTISQP